MILNRVRAVKLRVKSDRLRNLLIHQQLVTGQQDQSGAWELKQWAIVRPVAQQVAACDGALAPPDGAPEP